MKHRSIIPFVLVLFAAQLFCAWPPGPESNPKPSNVSIGQIERIQGGVQAGPESSLANVDPLKEMFNNDAIHVFDNGKAKIDFGYGLAFTLYNDTVSGGARVDNSGTSRQAAIDLSQGGLKGYNPPGSETRVKVSDNVNVIILGTHYFIAYDPVEDKVWIYNVDGIMQYQLRDGSQQVLFAGNLVEITHGNSTHLYQGLSFTDDDFDRLATTHNSPIRAVKEMLGGGPIPDTGGVIDTPTVTATPSQTQTSTETPTTTPTSTPTATPSQTATPIPCYLARFVADVTIPDASIINPITFFTKTWRLRNMGSCTWDSRYQLIFVEGTSMSRVKTFPWTGGTVTYGSNVDLSVNLITPETPGTYQGYFMLLAPDGTIFGLGPENRSFWVKVVVPLLNSPPDVPQPIAPTQNEFFYCGDTASLDWSIPYDDKGIAEYEVRLEKWPTSCSTWCSVFSTSPVLLIGDNLDITNYLECEVPYRWAVRAKDTDGVWSGWSEWIYFKVFARLY